MCDCSKNESTEAGTGTSMPVVSAGPTMNPMVPLSRPLRMDADESDDQPPATPVPLPLPPGPFTPLTLCRLDFREGCYQIHFRPTASLVTFEGTLRVDRTTPDGGVDHVIVSGDLYSKLPVIGPVTPLAPLQPVSDDDAPSTARATTVACALSAADQPPLVPTPFLRPSIPIFPRSRYHSYLKVTSVSAPIAVPAPKKCQLAIVAEQFTYTQPPAGQFKGTFPATPSRTVTLRLVKVTPPFPFSLTGGPYYEGRLFEGAVDKGAVTLAWVSKFFRRATLEIDTLTGAIRPAPVPDGAGGTEFFDTVYARIGWQLRIVQDQLNVPVPAGVVATNCWSSADLHGLMTSVRNVATNLDREWRVHMVVVPAKLGCGRGVMYDQIGVPREGCASFCDDGYPTSNSSNFGAAANKKQRDVPRAFLRSATHELTHTLNQIHQEQETTADNSIMTTTPSVADVLGGPASGEPGVFPDQIKLQINTTVRHHLNHMPDPVIRPGGWPFASWFPTGAPQAVDRHDFAPSELALTVTAPVARVALGQPLDLTWTLTNTSAITLRVPNDVSTEALFASITVTDGEGRERPVRPFAIVCDGATLSALEPGDSVTASTKVFWSTAGFAFGRPGRYRVDVAVSWSASGVAVGVQNGVDVYVDYPTSDADNHAANLVMHPEVGQWVALGGDAYHLAEAGRRLLALSDTAAPIAGSARAVRDAGAAPRVLDGFANLLPARSRIQKLYPDAAASRPAHAGGRRPAKATARAGASTRRAATRDRGRGRK